MTVSKFGSGSKLSLPYALQQFSIFVQFIIAGFGGEGGERVKELLSLRGVSCILLLCVSVTLQNTRLLAD